MTATSVSVLCAVLAMTLGIVQGVYNVDEEYLTDNQRVLEEFETTDLMLGVAQAIDTRVNNGGNSGDVLVTGINYTNLGIFFLVAIICVIIITHKMLITEELIEKLGERKLKDKWSIKKRGIKVSKRRAFKGARLHLLSRVNRETLREKRGYKRKGI